MNLEARECELVAPIEIAQGIYIKSGKKLWYCNCGTYSTTNPNYLLAHIGKKKKN